MKCPECGREGLMEEFETDNLNDTTDITDDNYMHVCPACVFHFLKREQ